VDEPEDQGHVRETQRLRFPGPRRFAPPLRAGGNKRVDARSTSGRSLSSEKGTNSGFEVVVPESQGQNLALTVLYSFKFARQRPEDQGKVREPQRLRFPGPLPSELVTNNPFKASFWP